MQIQYRTGNCWKTTVIAVDLDEEQDKDGRRPSDRLVALAQTPADARTIVDGLNTVTL